ncbi:hypothetical protein NEOC65_000475 [Neochlamydia sp. AcF65]|uniref:hypothetical protein n=1 Tax=Neochlamydia sp. AcF65 TaxID=2795735 RepID=UPI001BCA5C56|nr:hypothetical protein [Neochlamydia sp. AcF65]MBS4165415.1 hypothetical protein [Neochlamydia sp. AcF65]
MQIDSINHYGSLIFFNSLEMKEIYKTEKQVINMLKSMQSVFTDYLEKTYISKEKKLQEIKLQRQYATYLQYIKDSSCSSCSDASEKEKEGSSSVAALNYIIATCSLLAQNTLKNREKISRQVCEQHLKKEPEEKLEEIQLEIEAEAFKKMRKLLQYEESISQIIKRLKQACKFSDIISSNSRSISLNTQKMIKKYPSEATKEIKESEAKKEKEIHAYLEALWKKWGENTCYVFPIGYLTKNAGRHDSQGHLLLLEVEYLNEEEVKVMVINTGEQAEKSEDECALGIRVQIHGQVLLSIIKGFASLLSLIQEDNNIEQVYELIKALKEKSSKVEKVPRQPPIQQGPTCAYSCIIAYLYIRLKPKLFKFYMENYGSYILKIWDKWRQSEELFQTSRNENVLKELQILSASFPPPDFVDTYVTPPVSYIRTKCTTIWDKINRKKLGE